MSTFELGQYKSDTWVKGENPISKSKLFPGYKSCPHQLVYARQGLMPSPFLLSAQHPRHLSTMKILTTTD